MSKIVTMEHHSFTGGIWIIGWLFTIGFLQLSFWQGVLAVLLWPYYFGAALGALFLNI